MGLLPDYSFKAKLWLSIMRRWRPALIILIIISLLGIIATYNINSRYEAKTKLKFKSRNVTSLTTDATPNKTTPLPTEEQANFIGSEVEVLLSDPLIKKTISQLQLQNNQGKLLTTKQFKQQLRVKQIATTEIVEISYRDLDRKIAAQVVNTLVTNYIDNNLFIVQEELSTSKDFVNNQLSQSEETLEKLEKSIAKIKEDNQILAPQEASKNLTKTLEEVNRQIIINRAEIAKLKSKSKLITDKLGMNSDQALITVKVNKSLAVQNLAQQLQELELQLIREKSNVTEDGSKIVEIKKEISLKQELLQKQIAAIAGNQQVMLFENSDLDIFQELTLELVQLEANNIGLNEQLQYLVKIEQEKIQKAGLLPELELQLRQLERKLNTSQNSYQLLLQDLNKIIFAESQNNSNVRVISSEIAPKSSLTSYIPYYLASLLLGLVAAIVVIYILEIIDYSLKTLAEAERLFGYSWLGIIPALSSRSYNKNNQNIIPQLIVQENPISDIHESYRILSSNLEFICSRNKFKTIVITSSMPQEGKSSIAANLAYMMAQKGKNLLLIDANLPSPTQGKIWDIYHDIGISNFIAERFSPQSVIQRAMPNLDIIAAGEINSSTPVVLDSLRMQSFLENCSNIYDFIIIDSPALDTNADAITLGNIADGLLLIVQSGRVNRSQAKFAKELLAKSGQNILGLVFNEFNPSITTQNQKLEAAQSESVNLESSEASLWEIMSHYQRKDRSNPLIFDLDSQELNDISLAELEKNLNYLEQDLEKLTQMVKEQEDEFFLQGQIVRRLQKEVNLANISERAKFEQQLLQEQEIKDFLGETLLGQRRNLNQKKEILNQYKELLRTKKSSEAQLNGSNDH